MIPKVIHYCWFGGKPLPKSARKCISSWRKYLPDYEIKQWDETNFDINIIPYTTEAYKAHKYAFVSDFARFWILYKFGGLYFDTDVEVIRSMNDIIARGPFMGCEREAVNGANPKDLQVASGLGLGSEANNNLFGELIDFYTKKEFINPDGKSSPETVVTQVSEILCNHGLRNTNEVQLVNGFHIYPVDYFCPISISDGKLRITENTRSIHWYDQTWQSPLRKYGRKIILSLGGVKLKNMIKRFLIKN